MSILLWSLKYLFKAAHIALSVVDLYFSDFFDLRQM